MSMALNSECGVVAGVGVVVGWGRESAQGEGLRGVCCEPWTTSPPITMEWGTAGQAFVCLCAPTLTVRGYVTVAFTPLLFICLRYNVSTLARIGRIGPAFGVGGIANRSLREDWIITMESFDELLQLATPRK